MQAEIITYETKAMNNSKRSIISKRLFGFKDRTKQSRYIYERKGLLKQIPHLVITNKTFIVLNKDSKKIKKSIKGLGAYVKSWKINIGKGEIEKRYG
jgi:hypothetical protein